MNFLEFRLIDLIDIVVVAVLLYRLYWVIKGTVAQNIFIGLFAFMVFWLTIKALHMELLTTILNNFVNVGVLALIIVFQQEIRPGARNRHGRHRHRCSWRPDTGSGAYLYSRLAQRIYMVGRHRTGVWLVCSAPYRNVRIKDRSRA